MDSATGSTSPSPATERSSKRAAHEASPGGGESGRHAVLEGQLNVVREFIGADRALKRLARMKVEPHVRSATHIEIGKTIGQAKQAMGMGGYLWVVGKGGALAGWLDASALDADEGAPVARHMTAATSGECGVTTDATLRDALAKMMQSGIRNAPVVDSAGRLVGEVSLGVVMEA